MKDFLTDEEMAKLENPDFISDEEMKKLENSNYDWSKAPRDMAKSFTEALPIAGGAIGGVIGTPLGGPIGGVAGAGLGAALGKSLENIIESNFFDEQKTTGELLTDPIRSGLEGATGEGAGVLVSKGLQTAGPKIVKGFQNFAQAIEPPTQKPNAAEIIKAAKALDIEVTPAMLSDSGFLERLESSLAARPSMFGRSIARQKEGITQGLRQATESTMEKASDLSPFQLGEKFKSDVVADVAEKLDPISSLFDDIALSTKEVPLSKRSIDAVTRNIGNIPEVRLTAGAGKPQQYIDMLSRAENADDIKRIMSMLNQDYSVAQGAERAVLGQLKDKFSRLEQNSIMRAAIQSAKDSAGAVRTKTGEKIGRDLVGDLKDARNAYRDLAQGLQDVADTARFGQKRMSPNQFLGNLEGMASEQIPSKFFNVNDQRQLMSLKERFPEQFELLRQGKLGEIYQKSIDNSLMGQGEISTQRFLNAFRKLSPEAQKVLFDSDLSKIKNIETVQQSLPRNFNPSGTSGQESYFNIIKSTIEDVPQYLTYKGANSNLAQKYGQYFKSPQMLSLQRENPALFEQFVSRITQLGLQPQEQPQTKAPTLDKNRIMEKTQGSKYAQALQNAYQNGGEQSFNAAHFVLMNNDENYRQLNQDQE